MNLMEQELYLATHTSWSREDILNMSSGERVWFVKKLLDQQKKEQEALTRQKGVINTILKKFRG